MRNVVVLAVAALVLLPGCFIFPMRYALSMKWTRPGATAEQLSAAEYKCMQEWDGIPLYELCMAADGWKRK